LFVILLIFASLVALILEKSYIDFIVIMIIVIINIAISIYQEYKAENVMEKLREYASPRAKVLRNGKIKEVQAKEIVPGDIIILEEGDKIPADARIIESISLEVDESPLTGESVPIYKTQRILPIDASISDMINMVFMGTHVVRGRGRAVIVRTGMRTELGRIARMVEEIREEQTPLKIKLSIFAKKMAGLIAVLIVAIFLIGFIRFGIRHAIESFMVAISLAVAAVPEGLPAILTITLAMAARTLARNNALVKYLLAAETLGSVTVICSDKTGTITEGVMTVRKIYVGGKIYDIIVSGDKKGRFVLQGKDIDPMRDPLLSKILVISSLCTNVESEVELVGDPTELAIVIAATRAGYHKSGLEKMYPRVYEIPFSSSRKMMTTVNKFSDNEYCVCVKGAPELILNRCRFVEIEYEKLVEIDDEMRNSILEKINSYAAKGLRLLGVAYKNIAPKEINRDDVDSFLENELVFLGFIAISDPPRFEVYEAVKKTKMAGIRVIMVTGDHASTAKAIAEEIGLYEEGDKIVTGSDLDKMSEAELERDIMRIKVFARVMPEHKLKIVNVLKKKGEIVAMTGDGVNDAPALKAAHIGVAMGVRGTDVAKEAADMILLDDNFATIVKAVENGRKIYSKIRSFTRYLISCNIAEVFIIMLGTILFFEVPLLPAMILWINLVTDGPPATALAWDPSFDDVMRRQPRKTQEGLLSGMLTFIIVSSITLTLGTMITYYYYHIVLNASIAKIRTVIFLQLALFELFIVWNCRSETRSVWKIGFGGNKWLFLSVVICAFLTVSLVYIHPLTMAFHLVAIDWFDWVFVLSVASLGFLMVPEILMQKSN
ncbi:MAG: cation-translocating P-type ATPase, partial [Candidatus Njordarchaeota archaeon]